MELNKYHTICWYIGLRCAVLQVTM